MKTAIHKHSWDNETGKCWVCGVSFNPLSAKTAVHKHKWDKETGKCIVCGVGFSPMGGETKTARLNKDSKQVFIQAIMIESDLTESEAVVLWEKYKNYKNPDIKGFSNYLIELNPFQKIDKVYIDFVERVKARTIILKKETPKERNRKFTSPVEIKGIIVEKDKDEK